MSKDSCCSKKKCGIITASILGVILVVLGGVLVYVFDVVFVSIVEQESVIKEGNDFYPEWVEPTPPVYFALFVFNVTNPDEFLSGTPNNFVKPAFEQVGPYVYREYLKKDRIQFLDDEPEEVRYRSTTKIVFEPEMSGGSEDDMITTVNVIATGIPAILKYAFALPITENVSNPQKTAIYRIVNQLISETNSSLLFTKSIHDLLFGFQDPLLTSIVQVLEALPGVTEPLPDEFGLFQTMNNSAGWFDYQVFTGKNNYKLMNIVSEYQNMSVLPYWFGDECNAINGTDGTTTPAFINRDERIYFFVDDICRSMFATFYQEVDIKGVPGWEFRVPEELFKAPADSKENECYCPDLSMEVCQYNGGLPLTTCSYGAPVFMTSPHFLYASHYLDFVEGLDPNEEEHCTPLVYEPNSGTCMSADKRLQVNIYMEPDNRVDLMQSFDVTYAFPVLWLNESYILDDANADLMYSLLVVPADTAAILQIVFCIVGGVLIACVIAALTWMYLNRNQLVLVESDEKVGRPSSSNSSDHVYENGTMDLENDVFGNEKKEKPDGKVSHTHSKNITSTASTRELLESTGGTAL